MHSRCANPQCAAIETEPKSFQMCSKCQAAMPHSGGAKFCSSQCLKACWKVSHKAVCGTKDAIYRLPSEEACTAAYHAMADVASDSIAGMGSMGGALSSMRTMLARTENMAPSDLSHDC